MRYYLRLFAIGATAYPLLELAWRGRTHWTMGLVGGAGAALLGRVSRLGLPLACRCGLGGASLTGLEFISGCLLNRWLKLGIWDYSSRRGQVLGQICPAYAAGWLALASGVMVMLDRLSPGRRPFRAASR